MTDESQDRHPASNSADSAETSRKTSTEGKSGWSSPLVVAIFAAATAAAGNAWVAYINGQDQVALEEHKAEQERILEMIKTGDAETATNNLRFLLEAGLIQDATRAAKLREYLSRAPAASGPVLPVPSGAGQSSGIGDPEGSATDPKIRALNRLKNREAPPTAQEIDSRVTLESLLEPGDDTGRFDDSKAATIRGFVVGVNMTGASSANLNASDPRAHDIHIYLAPTADAARSKWFVATVTPRIRVAKESEGKDWSAKALRGELLGHEAEVTGWLLFNALHARDSQNTNPAGSRVWRATAWELHPVTAIRVVGGGAL